MAAVSAVALETIITHKTDRSEIFLLGLQVFQTPLLRFKIKSSRVKIAYLCVCILEVLVCALNTFYSVLGRPSLKKWLHLVPVKFEEFERHMMIRRFQRNVSI